MNRRDFLSGAFVGATPGAAAAWCVRRQWNRDRSAWDREHQLAAATPPADEFRQSFSEQGEDIVLYHVLRDLLRVESPTYLDVGAAHPIRSNNTYLLYGTGARGVLVEPNPVFVALLRERRPRDTVVQAGIGVTDAVEADYYEIRGNPMLNTFSPQQVVHLQKGKTESVVERIVKMPLLNINRVIAEQLGRAPELISTDIEGLDYAVIRTLDLKRFRPGVICAEGAPMSAPDKLSRIAGYLLAQGYVVRGGSNVNTVFVDARRLASG